MCVCVCVFVCLCVCVYFNFQCVLCFETIEYNVGPSKSFASLGCHVVYPPQPVRTMYQYFSSVNVIAQCTM